MANDNRQEDGFSLDPRLAADTILIKDIGLSRVLLMNDSRYPWLILVPRIAGATELHHLSKSNRDLLMEEITQTSTGLSELYDPDKINVGALGNIVSQLHVHVVARRLSDDAWPGPVWGLGAAIPYSEGETIRMVAEIGSKFD